MKKVLIFTLVLLVVLAAGCVERGAEQQIAPTEGTKTTEENVLSASSEISSSIPVGPYRIIMSFSETPALNKDVELTITATTLERHEPPIKLPNTSIGFWTAKYDPVDFRWPSPERNEVLWVGTISYNETVQVKHLFRIVEPGYYIIVGYAKGWYGNSVMLYLNVTEKSTRVNTVPFVLPPPPPRPDRPYVVNLVINGIPKLDNTVDLEVIIASMIEKENATFTVILPEGINFVSGDLNWSGNLRKGVPDDWREKLNATSPLELRRLNKSVPGEIIRVSNIPPANLVKIRAKIKPIKEGDWCIAVVPFGEPLPPVECSYDVPVTYPESTRTAYTIGGTLHVKVKKDSGATSEIGFGAYPSIIPAPNATPPVPKEIPPESPVPTTLPPGTTPSPPVPEPFTPSNITPTILSPPPAIPP